MHYIGTTPCQSHLVAVVVKYIMVLVVHGTQHERSSQTVGFAYMIGCTFTTCLLRRRVFSLRVPIVRTQRVVSYIYVRLTPCHESQSTPFISCFAALFSTISKSLLPLTWTPICDSVVGFSGGHRAVG